jgi:peptide/nickel transport system permease protein
VSTSATDAAARRGQRQDRSMSVRALALKLLGALATLAFVVVFNFFLFRIVDTDPVASLFRGRNLTQTQRSDLRREFGLDRTLPQQFGHYLVQTARLNFGRSYASNAPVMSEIEDRAWPTILLVGSSALLSMVFGVMIGIAAGWKRGSVTDHVSTALTMATYAMPDFWLGMLLLTTFSVALDWFPVGGIVDPSSDATGLAKLLDQAHHMVLPVLTLTIAYLGEYALVMRASLLDTMREDYLTLARAKGLRDVEVRNRHAVPNAILPVVTLIAINFGFVLSGAIAVETIFSWPGLGLLTYEALRGPDLPLLQGLFLVFSASVIFFNLIADVLYAALDPRVRTA